MSGSSNSRRNRVRPTGSLAFRIYGLWRNFAP
jgi:hypothetical protein